MLWVLMRALNGGKSLKKRKKNLQILHNMIYSWQNLFSVNEKPADKALNRLF